MQLPQPTPPVRTSLLRWSGLAASLLLLAACASTPVPNAQMAVSNAALAQAVRAGSAEWAPAELAMARDKMSRAVQAIAGKDNAAALDLAQQAQLDAQLAQAKSESAKARQSAMALQEASRVLQEEMNRKRP